MTIHSGPGFRGFPYRRSTRTIALIRLITPFILTVLLTHTSAMGATVAHDYDGDGKSDFALYSSTGGIWDVKLSSGGTTNTPLGWSNAVPISADFDGDGIADYAAYLPTGGILHVVFSAGGNISADMGCTNAIPVAGDYDGDGRSDFAVYQPSSGVWHVEFSSGGSMTTNPGRLGMIPVAGDYDGDGRNDIAMYYPPDGNWYIYASTLGFRLEQFGYAGTVPVAGDYDYDGRSDLAVYDPVDGNGSWYIFASSSGFQQIQFGYEGTIPAPGDYDGDHSTDIAIYDPASTVWYVLQSSSGFRQENWGVPGALPVANYVQYYWGTHLDIDGDGMPNMWEWQYGLDAWSNDSTNDVDSDFMTNLQEFQYNCIPTNRDTDGDSLTDGWEIWYGANPTHPPITPIPGYEMLKLGSYNTPYHARDIFVLSNLAYVADVDSGLQIINISNPTNPTLAGTFRNPLRTSMAYGVEVISNIAYVASHMGGLDILNVSNPTNPALIGTCDTPGGGFGVHIVSNLAYLADTGAGMTIVDVGDPAHPVIVGSNNTPGSAWRVSVVSNFAYVADGTCGVQIINVENPANPISVGSYRTPGSAYGIFVVSNLAYVADGATGLLILDVSNPASPTFLGSYDTPVVAMGIYVVSNLAYVVDTSAGLLLVDVSDPSTPSLVGSYDTPGYGRAVHVISNIAYVADGRTSVPSGLIIIRCDLKDSDQDGLPDTWEMDNFGSLDEGPDDDFDNDGILNRGELLAGLDPDNTDQDGDGLEDGDEVWLYNSHPALVDSDGDGIEDYEEVNSGDDGFVTRPDLVDTDNDGVADPTEIDLGRDPTDPTDGRWNELSTLSGVVQGSGSAGIPLAYVELHGSQGHLYYRAETDMDGIYRIENMLAGKYYIKAGADDFADEWYVDATHRTNAVRFTVSKNTTISGFDFALEAGQNPGLVEITSDPAGATVYLDYQATTNVTPVVLNIGEIGLPASHAYWSPVSHGAWYMYPASSHTLWYRYAAASHTISVSKPGRPQPSPREVCAKEAETVSMHFDLVPDSAGAVSIETTPAGMNVYVDYANAVAGVSPLMVTNLAPGSHTILIKHRNYQQPRPVKVWVNADYTNMVTIPMTSRVANTGLTVNVQSVPTGAVVYVDYLATTNITDTVVDWLDPASHAGDGWYSVSHTIMLRKQGYLPPATVYVTTTNEAQTAIFYLGGDEQASVDSDMDGLPDSYEAAYDLPNQAPTKHGASDDPDGDGLSNEEEMNAGTHPLNPNSVFKIQNAIKNKQAGTLTLRFKTQIGRMYIVQATDTLPGSWYNISGILVADDTWLSYEIPMPDETQKRYYRVVVLAQ